MSLRVVSLAKRLTFIAVLLVASCTAAPQRITVRDAYARPAPSSAETGAAFMIITNNTQEGDRLVSASSPAARTVELHETTIENGVMRMQHQPQGFEIPARGSVELKPGGKHIMLIGLLTGLTTGQTIEITLNFENAGPLTVEARVAQP